ncbi:MAG: MBOAT family protein, partial [Algoriphagus sp.]
GLTVFAWIFFRANSMGHAVSYIAEIFSGSLFTVPDFEGSGRAFRLFILVILFMLVEWRGREDQYAIETLGLQWKRPIRRALYFGIIILLFWFGQNEQQFIYFQF